MTKQEQRTIAIAAARSYMREHGADPITATPAALCQTFGELSEAGPFTVAGAWWREASDAQWTAARREFAKWQQSQKEIAK